MTKEKYILYLHEHEQTDRRRILDHLHAVLAGLKHTWGEINAYELIHHKSGKTLRKG